MLGARDKMKALNVFFCSETQRLQDREEERADRESERDTGGETPTSYLFKFVRFNIT